jgi:hypothetical protein
MILGNFALATALLTAVIAGCSFAYMIGYFTAFESKSGVFVTGLVQYSDVLQFAFTIAGNILVIVVAGFALLTVELSKRFRHPRARIDAQTVATIVVTPLVVWACLAADGYTWDVATLFLGVTILVGVISANLAWREHAFKPHRIIPTLLMAFIAFLILGLYFGAAAKEQQRFQVSIGDAEPRSVRLIAILSHGYLFLDPSNQHILLVPEKEIKLIDHEPWTRQGGNSAR